MKMFIQIVVIILVYLCRYPFYDLSRSRQMIQAGQALPAIGFRLCGVIGIISLFFLILSLIARHFGYVYGWALDASIVSYLLTAVVQFYIDHNTQMVPEETP